MTYTYYGNSANNYFNYTGSDRLLAYGYAGNDYLYGNNGNDSIYGGNGNDTLLGYYGNDYIDGGYGNDTINGGYGNDSVYGGYGNDTIDGGYGNDYLNGGSGNDRIYGGYGNDTILGMSGNDYIDGGAGNDRIDGYATTGTEYDTLRGGAGSDTFVLGGSWGVSYRGSGYALITDWDRSSDYLEVKGTASQYSLHTGNWAGTSARDMGVYYGNDLIAVLQDTTNITLNTHDFRFV